MYSYMYIRGLTAASKYIHIPKYTRHCNTLQHTATLYNTLQHAATRCNTLQCTRYIHTHLYTQHTATHCNTLQHTATRCNTLQCTPYIHTHLYIHLSLYLPTHVYVYRWRRLIGCLQSQVIFRTRANNYWALLRKMTYKDKASYDSTPPCTYSCFIFFEITVK